ncbi:TPA: GGDEF domain-containing protein [Candidatus Saccharibacteria bacterium]|nr:GGDEF domain-containing protein [Candidatus Saccharibacteria bacterium]HIO87665.1 GGDEF domain-containing protein [Candidatus Saccharibacteria bacterium]
MSLENLPQQSEEEQWLVRAISDSIIIASLETAHIAQYKLFQDQLELIKAQTSEIAALERLTIKLLLEKQELEKAMTYDKLTGLLREESIEREVFPQVDRKLKDSALYHLVYADVDDFSAVNNIEGHDRGDEALALIAEKMKESTKSGIDFLIRSNDAGDEFILIIEGDLKTAKQVGKRINLTLAEEEHFAGTPLSLSVGCAPLRGTTPELYSASKILAETRMRIAKEIKKDT